MLSRPLCAWLPCAICSRLSSVNKQRLQNQALGGCADERRNSWGEINLRKEQSRVRRKAQLHCQISCMFIGSWEKQFDGAFALPVLAVLRLFSCFRFLSVIAFSCSCSLPSFYLPLIACSVDSLLMYSYYVLTQSKSEPRSNVTVWESCETPLKTAVCKCSVWPSNAQCTFWIQALVKYRKKYAYPWCH